MLKKTSKRRIIFFSFLINTIILVASASFLYKIDPQKFHKGLNGTFDNLGIVTLLFYIPIITWLNIIMVRLKKK